MCNLTCSFINEHSPTKMWLGLSPRQYNFSQKQPFTLRGHATTVDLLFSRVQIIRLHGLYVQCMVKYMTAFMQEYLSSVIPSTCIWASLGPLNQSSIHCSPIFPIPCICFFSGLHCLLWTWKELSKTWKYSD